MRSNKFPFPNIRNFIQGPVGKNKFRFNWFAVRKSLLTPILIGLLEQYNLEVIVIMSTDLHYSLPEKC